MDKIKKTAKVINEINDSTVVHLLLLLLAVVRPEAAIYSEILKYTINIIATSGKIYTITQNRDIDKKTIDECQDELKQCLEDTMKLLKQRAIKKQNVELTEDDKKIIISLFQNIIIHKYTDINTLRKAVNHAIIKVDSGCLEQYNSDFHSAFNTCLFSYPKLNSYLIRNDSEEHMLNMKSFLNNEFVYKLSLLSGYDGILNCFYKVFSNYVVCYSMDSSIAKFLSKVQEEYSCFIYKDVSELRFQKKHSETLSELLVSVDGYELRNNCDELILFYLDFIYAEKNYYEGDYWLAIIGYRRLLDNERLKKLRTMDIKGMDDFVKKSSVYLSNSLAWAYHLSGDNEKAISVYENNLNEDTPFPSPSFKARCLRNHGVCLAQKNRHDEAVTLYQKSINYLSEGASEFKVYIDYCSSLMRIWDRETKKVSSKWAKNIKNIFERTNLSSENISKIKTYLHIAEMRKSMFSDIYVQKVKLLTYLLLLTDNKSIEHQYDREIIELLFFIKTIAPDITGIKHVRRDYYFAKYLKEKNKENKNLWLIKVEEENAMIKHNQEAEEFIKLISELK